MVKSPKLFLQCFCPPFWWLFAFVFFTVLVDCVCHLPPQVLLLCYGNQTLQWARYIELVEAFLFTFLTRLLRSGASFHVRAAQSYLFLCGLALPSSCSRSMLRAKLSCCLRKGTRLCRAP